jgi:SAM-dependent methyltransferase
MNETFTYHEYVTDEKFLAEYNAYQAKYAKQVRESDKVLIGLIRDVVEKRGNIGRPLRLLDVGCSTGNLLLHLKRLIPSLSLTGGDLAESSLEECRANPELIGIDFKIADMLNLAADSFDMITVNAVLYMMEEPQFEQSLRSINNALSSGGSMFVFDFFHPFEQYLSILERSRSHPNGLRLTFRSMHRVNEQLKEAGFCIPTYRPFTLPIDLPLMSDGELVTYTVSTTDERRLPFRGTLFQPWCHMVTLKA